ncbi:MAG TPA: NUDIX hydrolase [Burkholderiaceae bacterium]|nr:NUDIX hydrolase [Burkholderiaceae bacterium]
MNYCSLCAHRLELRVPKGDNRPRYCCAHCGAIHYENPRVVLGTIPEYDGRVLLCRRAIEPRSGFWTLPAGFMENGETTAEGALRETREESGATIELLDVFSIIDVVHVAQVHLFYRARMANSAFEAGTESLEVRLFDEAEIPWDDLAFLTTAGTLRAFFADRAQGRFKTHVGFVEGHSLRWHQR